MYFGTNPKPSFRELSILYLTHRAEENFKRLFLCRPLPPERCVPKASKTCISVFQQALPGDNCSMSGIKNEK